jgi:hypothetical protein
MIGFQLTRQPVNGKRRIEPARFFGGVHFSIAAVRLNARPVFV